MFNEPNKKALKQYKERYQHLTTKNFPPIKYLPLWKFVDFPTKTFPRAVTDFISHRKVHKFIPHSLCINIFSFFPIQTANYQQITIANQLSQPFAWFYNKHIRDFLAYSELCWV